MPSLGRRGILGQPSPDITPGGYDISVEIHDCTSGRNALAADAPAMDAPGKDDQNIE